MNNFLVNLHVGNKSTTVSAEKGQTIAEVINKTNLFFAQPCAGTQSCGKCAVWANGQLSPLAEKEKTIANLP